MVSLVISYKSTLQEDFKLETACFLMCSVNSSAMSICWGSYGHIRIPHYGEKATDKEVLAAVGRSVVFGTGKKAPPLPFQYGQPRAM